MVRDITVARLLMGIVTTSCTVFIDCGRLLLIGLSRRYVCGCWSDVFSTTSGGTCWQEGKKIKTRREMRKIDLLSYGDKQHHGIIRNFLSWTAWASSSYSSHNCSLRPWDWRVRSNFRLLTLTGWLFMVVMVMMMLLLVLNDNLSLQRRWRR